MLFNSIEFALFLPIVFVLYWFVFGRNLRLQNLFIVAASYLFYGWWDWKFLILIALTTLLSYGSGLLIEQYRGKDITVKWYNNRAYLISAGNIVINLGILFYFKYCNFFIDSFAHMFTLFGKTLNYTSLSIILPVGISFYTFQALSYSIDVYKRKIKATNDVVSFFAFVSFFPQLVAGPIERSTQLLPQFFSKRKFDCEQGIDGMRQILWGLFKKIVIADNCAWLVNQTFNDYCSLSGSTLLLGAIFFAFQIYGDFSGYSDIAIGTAKLFGINLMRNFNYPYFSRDIGEFWRRWHISLTTWFRDYLYIPLGGSWGNKWQTIRNTFIIFLVSGFWHGASWTFIAWGGCHAILFMPSLLTNKNRRYLNTVASGNIFPSWKEGFQMLTTFLLVVIAWVFFRTETIGEAIGYIGGIFSKSLFSIPDINLTSLTTLCFVIVMLVVEWLQRDRRHGLEIKGIFKHRIVRFAIYYILIFVILGFGGKEETFIYFQF